MILHKKHGLAPTIPICFICGKKKNEVALLGATWKGKEAPPMQMVMDKTPCEECKKYMQMGVILISVKDNEPDKDNPYRTGGWCVVKEDAVKEIFGVSSVLLHSRVGFLEDEAWDKIGLPREKVSL